MIEAVVLDAYGTLFDVQSVGDAIEEAFPGKGDYLTQVWRLKQMEYSWLRALGGTYADFWRVTLEALEFSLKTLGISVPERRLAELADAYNRLNPYPEAAASLAGLGDYRRVILSNGSPAMLAALLDHSGLASLFDAVLSVDSVKTYKPHPAAYGLVGEQLGIAPGKVLFVSSNGFDVCGAKNFGFRVARLERGSASALRQELALHDIGPKSFYKALRTLPETFGPGADVVLDSLVELPVVAAR
jgi:2-haloacid dehalogenase